MLSIVRVEGPPRQASWQTKRLALAGMGKMFGLSRRLSWQDRDKGS